LEDDLLTRIRKMAFDVGPRRYCFELSEAVPPNWRKTIPLILKELASLDGALRPQGERP
jgi:hypothetical protein